MEPRVYHRTPRCGSAALTVEPAAAMPPQHTPASRHVRAQPNAKNVFDREPLLIPQRPEDRPRPWYRRRAVVTSILLVLAAVVAIVLHFGPSVSRAFAGTPGN